MQPEGTYSSDVEGGAPVCIRYRIAGRMQTRDYLAFVAERARWLDISGWAEADATDGVTLVAAGPEALVGALEMACALGPLNALIERIEGAEEAGPVAPGFAIRR